MNTEIPEGYIYEPSTSAFINHVGKVFRKTVTEDDSEDQSWIAIRVEPHHVNTWGFAHGSFLAALAEIGTSGGYDPDGPPVVTIDLQTHFIKAPKVGELIEICGLITRRTRSLVFASSRATVDGDVVFSSTAIHKVVGA